MKSFTEKEQGFILSRTRGEQLRKQALGDLRNDMEENMGFSKTRLNKRKFAMNKGLVIGTSDLVNLSNKTYLVSCGNCRTLFNITKKNLNKKVKCPDCKENLIVTYQEL